MEKGGFTIIEVLIAIMLVGLAIVSLVAANSSFTKANNDATVLSTAEFLIEQIRELTTLLSVVDPQDGTGTFGPEPNEVTLADYDDLDDFDDARFETPINAEREILNDFAAFSQEVTVENISDTNFENIVSDHSSHFVKVTAKVLLNSKEIISTSWIRARY